MGEAFRTIIPRLEGRVLIASFASNIHRVQQAIDVALETDRQVALVGRSLRKNVNIARSLGYLDVPEEILVKPADLDNLRPEQTMILCTGSQGEPMSALTRIAYGDHQHVTVEADDTVIISAKPVPGNELRVHDTINRLTRAGALVLHQEIAAVHTSGHGNSDEIRTVLALVRPKNVMPVHGEFRMLDAQARLARESGVPADRIVLAENGSVVELSNGVARIVDHVATGATFVDGLGVGDVREASLKDRRHLSEDGVLIVVVTIGGRNGQSVAPPGADRARLRRSRPGVRGGARGGRAHGRDAPRRRHRRAQAPRGARPRGRGPSRLRTHPPPPDDPAGRRRGLSRLRGGATPSVRYH